MVEPIELTREVDLQWPTSGSPSPCWHPSPCAANGGLVVARLDFSRAAQPIHNFEGKAKICDGHHSRDDPVVRPIRLGILAAILHRRNTMSIARSLSFIFVTAVAATAFTPAAHAQVPCCVRSGDSAETNGYLQPVRVAELNQRKHAKDRTKARTVHIAKHKKHRPARVVQKPGLDSIIFRVAPYDFTWA
jgi:hypothetical protein